MTGGETNRRISSLNSLRRAAFPSQSVQLCEPAWVLRSVEIVAAPPCGPLRFSPWRPTAQVPKTYQPLARPFNLLNPYKSPCLLSSCPKRLSLPLLRSCFHRCIASPSLPLHPYAFVHRTHHGLPLEELPRLHLAPHAFHSHHH